MDRLSLSQLLGTVLVQLGWNLWTLWTQWTSLTLTRLPVWTLFYCVDSMGAFALKRLVSGSNPDNPVKNQFPSRILCFTNKLLFVLPQP